MIKSKYYTLPNNLANENLVPELIQEDITADNVFNEVEQQFIQDEVQRNHMLTRFDEIHKQLSQDASKKAAQAIHTLLEGSMSKNAKPDKDKQEKDKQEKDKQEKDKPEGANS